MYLFLWTAVVFLRFLPLCTPSPVPATSKPNTQIIKSSASDACNITSSGGLSSACWTILNMEDFFANWTSKTVMVNAPMIGTMYCRPNEAWAQCFLRFAYGQQRQPSASIDCSTFSSTSCQSPSNSLMAKPTSTQYYYGAYAIYAIFTYITTLCSALLSTTAKPGALRTAYASANAGVGAASGANPIDATLFQLLFENGLTDQDIAFTTYMKQNPFAGAFTGATTEPLSDATMYRDLVAVLKQRLQKLMSGWDSFEQVLGTGGEWTTQVQDAGVFVKKWTSGSTS